MFGVKKFMNFKIKTAASLIIFTLLQATKQPLHLPRTMAIYLRRDMCPSQDTRLGNLSPATCAGAEHHYVIPSRRAETQAQSSSAESTKHALQFLFARIFYYTAGGAFPKFSHFLFMSLHLLHPKRQSLQATLSNKNSASWKDTAWSFVACREFADSTEIRTCI